MPATAERFGLTVNDRQDQGLRLNPQHSCGDAVSRFFVSQV
ncbi:hypothetical protein OK016_27380 [Vibrio chagasii]|nr:hypothetical protein [Vibrio chagasii]